MQDAILELRILMNKGDLVFLDYETNCDVSNLKKPLSHAGLVRAYLLDEWPSSHVGQRPL